MDVEVKLVRKQQGDSMKPPFVIAILALTLGILGFAYLFSSGGRAPGPPPAAQADSALSPKKELPAASPSTATNDKTTVSVTPVAEGTNHADYVRARVAELMVLAMNDDANSLKTIWSELSNPDKEIRAGALEAVVQFGDRSVVPNLRALAAQTEDPAEKASLLAAADHLELPPLTEARRTPQTNAAP